MTYQAEIISVGTELLLGNIVNTDARDISQMLSEIGINVFYHTVVGDNPTRLKEALAVARSRANIIITTGGLGPTYDDLTKQTLADAFGKKLLFDEAAAEEMRQYFYSNLHRTVITENNYQQAMLPEGCTVFHNTCGTAPGCAFESENIHVLMLPGPPRECITMFRLSAVPYLKALSSEQIYSHNIHIFGMGESSVENILRPLMVELTNPTLAPYAKEGEVCLRLTAKADSEKRAEEMMAPVLSKVKETLGDVIYSVDIDSLEEAVLSLLLEKGKTLAAAESCTGGLLAKRITDLPGSSAAFLGGAVTYTNGAKNAMLGVKAETLETYGAVSAETAIEMARGVKALLSSDIGIAITGIAGPSTDGVCPEVGRVFVALAADGTAVCHRLHLGTDRLRTRTVASSRGFDMVRRYLTSKAL